MSRVRNALHANATGRVKILVCLRKDKATEREIHQARKSLNGYAVTGKFVDVLSSIPSRRRSPHATQRQNERR